LSYKSKPEVVTFFNERAKGWSNRINPRNHEIAEIMINRLAIRDGDSVLDVGAGTGILFSLLKNRRLGQYVALDISNKMVEEFLDSHPGTDVRCLDYEADVLLESNFDFAIIFNSIPHFDNLNGVFLNAYTNLKAGGKFSISHSRTREGLKEHYSRIGYIPAKEPIPTDETLYQLSKEYGFKNVVIENREYFFFSCKK